MLTRASGVTNRPFPPGVLERFPNLHDMLSATDTTRTAGGPMRHVRAFVGALASSGSGCGDGGSRLLPWRLLRWPLARVANRRRALEEAAPEEFVCPITHELLIDPVVASDGHTYERQAIREVIDRQNGLSPLTRETLAREVYSNFGLRQRVATWREGQGEPNGTPSPSSIGLSPVRLMSMAASVSMATALLALALARGWGCTCECM